MFFIPCDSWKTLFFLRVCRYCEIFSAAILLFSLKQVFWKTSVFWNLALALVLVIHCYYEDNSILLILMLMLSSKKKLSYTILIHTWKTFVCSWLFYDYVFYTVHLFNCSTLFFIKLFFFFWKTQNISESIFLHNTVELLNSEFSYIKWEQNYISKLHTWWRKF